ncbi:hypothetical protein HY640_02550 [Candidatus Woesearchaeota archaeon]|nr:hypothetical protein [Candidatus Woesearchaeota archaeon]
MNRTKPAEKTALALIITLLATAGCAKEYTSAESINDLIAQSSLEKRVKIDAYIKQGAAECSTQTCSQQNPCCNTCTAKLQMQNQGGGITITLDKQCTGTNCEINCPAQPNTTHTLKGRLKLNNLGQHTLFVDYIDEEKA